MSDILLGKADAVSPHPIHYYEVEGIRRGKWKVVKRKKNLELYNLETDLGERKNIAKDHPELVKELKGLLDAHAATIKSDTRPAAFVDHAKPILTEPGDLPMLREYVGKPETTAANTPAKKGLPAPAKPKTSSEVKGELLFPNSDFETGTLENWTAKGDAFNAHPTKGDNPAARNREPSNHQGGWWIGGFEKYNGKIGKPGAITGDQLTGSLTSTECEIKDPFITFRIGAGKHPGKTGVKLLVSRKTLPKGKTMLSTTFHNAHGDALCSAIYVYVNRLDGLDDKADGSDSSTSPPASP